MTNHARVKGWRFTFRINVDEPPDPISVVVEGEVGDPTNNTWFRDDDLPIYYADEEAAIAIARDEVWEHVTDGEVWALNRDQVVWIETAQLHPDDYVGKKEVQLGVWL